MHNVARARGGCSTAALSADERFKDFACLHAGDASTRFTAAVAALDTVGAGGGGGAGASGGGGGGGGAALSSGGGGPAAGAAGRHGSGGGGGSSKARGRGTKRPRGEGADALTAPVGPVGVITEDYD